MGSTNVGTNHRSPAIDKVGLEDTADFEHLQDQRIFEELRDGTLLVPTLQATTTKLYNQATTRPATDSQPDPTPTTSAPHHRTVRPPVLEKAGADLEEMETILESMFMYSMVDHGEEAVMDQKVLDQLKDWEEQGYGHLPVCMAKTQYSFSTDPNQRGAPTGHVIPVREVRISAGAGFIVVVCGEIMTMPGLPRRPAAESIFVNENGEIEGLF